MMCFDYKKRPIVSVSYSQMKKGLIKYFVIFLVWILGGSANALEKKFDNVPKQNGLPAGVEFDGKKWHSTQILARLKKGVQKKTRMCSEHSPEAHSRSSKFNRTHDYVSGGCAVPVFAKFS